MNTLIPFTAGTADPAWGHHEPLGAVLGDRPTVPVLRAARPTHTVTLIRVARDDGAIRHLPGCERLDGDEDPGQAYTLDQAAELVVCGTCQHRGVRGPYVAAMRTGAWIRTAVDRLADLEVHLATRGYATGLDQRILANAVDAVDSLPLDVELAAEVADARNLDGVRDALAAMAARIDPRVIQRRAVLVDELLCDDCDELWRLLCPNLDPVQLQWMATAGGNGHSADGALWAQLCEVLDPVAALDAPATHVIVSRCAPNVAVPYRDLREVPVGGHSVWVWTGDALDAAAARRRQYDHICVAAADVGATDVDTLTWDLIAALAEHWDPARTGLAEVALWGERSS